MSIQDWALSICQWVFLVALMPSLCSDDKPAIATSLTTAITASVMAAVYATLGLWVSTASTALVALCWFILAQQRWQTKPRRGPLEHDDGPGLLSRAIANQERAAREQEDRYLKAGLQPPRDTYYGPYD